MCMKYISIYEANKNENIYVRQNTSKFRKQIDIKYMMMH